MLQVPHCRRRQQRLLDVMQTRGLAAVVVGQPRHAYYFTAYLPFWLHEAAFVLHSDGRSALVCGKDPESDVAADDVTVFESNWLGTQRQEQPAVVASHFVGWWKSGDWSRVALDASPVSAALEHVTGGAEHTIDEDLWQLRRCKDDDELALMKKAIACTRAMHERARQIVVPGMPELRV